MARKNVRNISCFLNFIMLTTEHQVPANYPPYIIASFRHVSALMVGSLSLSGKTAPGMRGQALSLTLAFFLSVILLEACSAFGTCEIYRRTTDSLSFPFLKVAVVMFPELPIYPLVSHEPTGMLSTWLAGFRSLTCLLGMVVLSKWS